MTQHPIAAASTASQPTHAQLAQAAQWYACLRDGQASAGERAAWQAWLAAAEAHALAWQYVEDISRAFEPVRSLPNPRHAVHQLHAANDRVRARRQILASVGILAGTGLLGLWGWRQGAMPAGLLALGADHRTATGEQRSLTLADGTRLWLNTASAVDIQFHAQERGIVLHRGEIFVETAQDARPLRVYTPHGQMRALGTRFNVLLDGDATQLAVYEGRVEVRTAASGVVQIFSPGEQTRFTAQAVASPAAADMAREAWTQGALVADNLPLWQVVQQLRRYRSGHLGVSDAVADLTVYGNFPLHDTDHALQMLASALPVRIAQPLPWWTTLEARD